jgi:hypothetical protein
MNDNLYSIEWSRPGEKDHQVCHGLDPRTLVARLISGTDLNGSIVVWKVEREKDVVGG